MCEQKVQMMEAVTMGCVEQANVYDIIDATNNRKIMVTTTPSREGFSRGTLTPEPSTSETRTLNLKP